MCVSCAQSASVHSVNALTGALQSTTPLSYSLLDAQLLPVDSPAGGSAAGSTTGSAAVPDDAVLLLDTGLRVHVFPSPARNEAIARALDALKGRMHFHITDVGAGTIKGFAVMPAEASARVTDTFATELVWTIALPTDIERIAAVAARPDNEFVHSAM
jgi:hypothetical protein